MRVEEGWNAVRRTSRAAQWKLRAALSWMADNFAAAETDALDRRETCCMVEPSPFSFPAPSICTARDLCLSADMKFMNAERSHHGNIRLLASGKNLKLRSYRGVNRRTLG